MRLIAENPRFAAFFYLDVAMKLDAAAREEEGARFTPLLGARVYDMHTHEAIVVDGATTIAEAGARMNAAKAYALFARDDDGIGVVTRSDLMNAAILDRRPLESRRSGRSPAGRSSRSRPTTSSRPRSSR